MTLTHVTISFTFWLRFLYVLCKVGNKFQTLIWQIIPTARNFPEQFEMWKVSELFSLVSESSFATFWWNCNLQIALLVAEYFRRERIEGAYGWKLFIFDLRLFYWWEYPYYLLKSGKSFYSIMHTGIVHNSIVVKWKFFF